MIRVHGESELDAEGRRDPLILDPIGVYLR
jgi:hypothetical protein